MKIKEEKNNTNCFNINNTEHNKFNKKLITNSKMKLDLLNDNDDDINNYTDYNNNYINKNTINDINNNDITNTNDITNNNIKEIEINLNKETTFSPLSSSSFSGSQNEFISKIIFTENHNHQYNYIYSLIGSDIISFNIREKKFEIITVKDNTNGIFNSYISFYEQNKLLPLLLNSPKGFFLLLHKYIFFYDQIDNTITILAKMISYHTNGCFINIKDDLYSLSGNNITQCEYFSLILNQTISLPNTNYPRINSGVCNINDEYIYLFFGQFCENSIERLYIGNDNNKSTIDNSCEKWELIKINEINGFNEGSIYLSKFIAFMDDFNNVIIFGGEDYSNRKMNKNIFGFNLNNNNLSVIGKIDSSSLYCSQYIMLDDSIFSIYDINNGLHFFNKELDYHEIFNLNI